MFLCCPMRCTVFHCSPAVFRRPDCSGCSFFPRGSFCRRHLLDAFPAAALSACPASFLPHSFPAALPARPLPSRAGTHPPARPPLKGTGCVRIASRVTASNEKVWTAVEWCMKKKRRQATGKAAKKTVQRQPHRRRPSGNGDNGLCGSCRTVQERSRRCGMAGRISPYFLISF